MERFIGFLRILFSGTDNTSWNLNKVLIAVGCFMFFGLQFEAIIKGQQWDPEAFGFGFMAILGGAGIAHKLTPDEGKTNVQ